MDSNMGFLDRAIRGFVALLALIFAVIIGFRQYPWIFALCCVVVLVMGLTAITGKCPLYIPLKISTKKKRKD
jgi:hypothetical protein